MIFNICRSVLVFALTLLCLCSFNVIVSAPSGAGQNINYLFTNSAQKILELHLLGLYQNFNQHTEQYFPLSKWPEDLTIKKNHLSQSASDKIIKTVAQGKCPNLIFNQVTSAYLTQEFSDLNTTYSPACFEIFTDNAATQRFLFAYFYLYLPLIFSNEGYSLYVKSVLSYDPKNLSSTVSTPCFLMETTNQNNEDQKAQTALCLIQTPKAPWED